MNAAFERTWGRNLAGGRSLRFSELVHVQDHEKTESVLRSLFDSVRDSISIETRSSNHGQPLQRWVVWRQPGIGEPDHALLVAEASIPLVPEEVPLQNQRWEAIGRLTGGVVHDFNNLLTGVMLYCDLLLSSLDSRDRRRRYVDEIRSAMVQAASLVQQLLIFARPQTALTPAVSLNQIAMAMENLLTRLIGENIALDLRLDPELGLVKIDQAQAQQILLNLVLNARDALPKGGKITIETSNCRFQPMAGTLAHQAAPAFPCVLLAVSDNGHGMNAETRQHLFEPFFTTKNAGKGTGLGLTTVRSIVSTHRGLIHFESEPDRGTTVLILLPQVSQLPHDAVRNTAGSGSRFLSPTSLHEIKKESIL